HPGSGRPSMPSSPSMNRPSMPSAPAGAGGAPRTMAIPSLQEAEMAPTPPPPAGPPAPKMRTMLGQMSFGGPESMAQRGQQAIIGRLPTSDIVLPYPQVSGRHTAVSVSPDGMLLVTDLGSTNGTH